jgi:hypothetical protein
VDTSLLFFRVPKLATCNSLNRTVDGRSLKVFGTKIKIARSPSLSLVGRCSSPCSAERRDVRNGIFATAVSRFAKYTGARPLIARCAERQSLYKIRGSTGSQCCCDESFFPRVRHILRSAIKNRLLSFHPSKLCRKPVQRLKRIRYCHRHWFVYWIW